MAFASLAVWALIFAGPLAVGIFLLEYSERRWKIERFYNQIAIATLCSFVLPPFLGFTFLGGGRWTHQAISTKSGNQGIYIGSGLGLHRFQDVK